MQARVNRQQLGDQVPGDRVPESHRAHRPAWIQRLSNWLLRTGGWQFRGEIPTESKLVLVVGPHTSNWDFLVGITAMLALDIHLHWLGKHSLFHKPFTGIMTWLGGIPVNRARPEGFAAEIADRFRREDELIVVITPEGTRKKVAKLKTGFSRIAREVPCPILPVTFDFVLREIVFHPVMGASEDSEGDAARVREIFATATAKNPANF